MGKYLHLFESEEDLDVVKYGKEPVFKSIVTSRGTFEFDGSFSESLEWYGPSESPTEERYWIVTFKTPNPGVFTGTCEEFDDIWDGPQSGRDSFPGAWDIDYACDDPGPDGYFIEILSVNAVYPGYLEPWVSLCTETGGVEFNKKRGWMRVPEYMSGSIALLPWSEEELQIINHPEEYLELDTTERKVVFKSNITFYFVGGITTDFDPEDPETYTVAFVPENYEYTSDNRIVIDDGDCREGFFKLTIKNGKITWIQGEGTSNCQ